ncbi:MAG: aspartate-semialdehyde dehydrogenase [Candidatus Nanohaloarchaea archaeon]
MSKIKLGILGATGMAGREAVKHHCQLKQRGEDYASLEIVTGSPETQGQNMAEVFTEKELEIAEKVDYVISALPSSVAKEVEPELREKGVNVFSNASEFRWGENIPLMIPEVNPGHIELTDNQEKQGIQVNNPNCTTAGFVPVIKALNDNYNVENVDIVTFQAISGKGDKAATQKYAEQIEGNVIDDWDNKARHNTEEIKSETEPQKILGLAEDKEEAKTEGLDISARTARVPTQYGHLEALEIKLDEEVDVEEVENVLNSWSPPEKVKDLPSSPEKPIMVIDKHPEPRQDSFKENGMAIVVGDLRKIDDKTVSMFSLSHNLRRGATWTARQSMELYLKEQNKL